MAWLIGLSLLFFALALKRIPLGQLVTTLPLAWTLAVALGTAGLFVAIGPVALCVVGAFSVLMALVGWRGVAVFAGVVAGLVLVVWALP